MRRKRHAEPLAALTSDELEVLASWNRERGEAYLCAADSEPDPCRRELALLLAEWRQARGRRFDWASAEQDAVEAEIAARLV